MQRKLSDLSRSPRPTRRPALPEVPAKVPAVLGPDKTKPTPLETLREVEEGLGPGLITGASDDDPSGIGTYSVAGAQFGFQTLWLAWVTLPLSAAVQELCARIGLVTGHGLATVTKQRFGKPVLAVVVFLLVVANTVNIGADLQAMAATLQLLIPGADFGILAISLTAIILTALITLSYRTFANILKITSLSLLAYVFVAFVSRVEWSEALHAFLNLKSGLAWGKLSNHAYVMTIVGIIGTTISPYLFFWQASEEVEEEIAQGKIRNDDPRVNHPNLTNLEPAVLKRMRIDVLTGMLYTVAIMFFIIVAAATHLYQPASSLDFNSLDLVSLANVLRPLVGDTAFLVFTIGIVGIGMLAVPVLAGSASYAIAELFDWKEGLHRRFHDAPGFYILIILATVIGLALNLLGIKPVAALFYTAILNGLIAAPLLFLLWRIGNDRQILGEHTSGWLSNTLVLTSFVVMTVAAVAMFLVQ